MPSFRTRVLDALDIKKDSVRIPIYETFNVPAPGVDQIYDETNQNCYGKQSYALSKCIRSKVIGPKMKKDRIEVLGFVVGDDPGITTTSSEPYYFRNMLPDCVNRTGTQFYTGIHHLGGLYDESNQMLMKMRKAAITPTDYDTMYAPSNHAATDSNGITIVNEHTHTDWPDNAKDQAIKLNDDPYADSLYYHETAIKFFLTGLDDVTAATDAGHSNGDASANHRGCVRMLVLRPKNPKVSMRVMGEAHNFRLNYDFPPNWETELFYDRDKQLGGRMTSREPHTRSTSTATAWAPHGYHALPTAGNYDSSAICTYGLTKVAKLNPDLETDTGSEHYGHFHPQDGGDHLLNPFDILTSPINTDRYAVLQDKTFTLDSLHHGAAAHHVCNVRIPYYKKVRFAGRKPVSDAPATDAQGNATDDYMPASDGTSLGPETFNEPLNLPNRPIVLFLSYNQRISAQVSGYTAVSET